jgi:hypothetical protein
MVRCARQGLSKPSVEVVMVLCALIWYNMIQWQADIPSSICVPAGKNRLIPQSAFYRPLPYLVTDIARRILYSGTRRPDRLIWIRWITVLAHPYLPPLLGRDMLDPYFVAMRLLEGADEPRVPQLRGYAQVFAAPQQCVRLAPFTCRRDRLLGKVLAFAAGLGDEAVGSLVLASKADCKC